MLAKIKFTRQSESNIMKESEINELEKYIGEKINYDHMKRDESGKLTTSEWRETFDEEYAKRNSDYTLIQKSGYIRLNSDESYIVDLHNFMSEYPNLEYSVKGLPKAIQSNNTDLISQMSSVADKIEEAKNRFNETIEFNQRCEVHVPNLGLLNINKLGYANDYCTEALQELLLLGWRIIAICPQPDQRRPDYILGMSVTGFDDNVQVQHFTSTREDK